jgi:hypothetical protein
MRQVPDTLRIPQQPFIASDENGLAALACSKAVIQVAFLILPLRVALGVLDQPAKAGGLGRRELGRF